MPNILRPDLALRVFEAGAIQFGMFHLHLHETRPDAPPSPIYCNFRASPAGPLSSDDVDALGKGVLHQRARLDGVRYEAVEGIPRAGVPRAESFAEVAAVPHYGLLHKEESGTGRISCVEAKRHKAEIWARVIPERMLLIDDVVTEAHSAIEAVQAMRSLGFSVTDVLVLVDREQGGEKALAEAGLTLHASWRLSELLRFYRERQLITEGKYQEVLAYLRVNR